jgi:hypothetical protein
LYKLRLVSVANRFTRNKKAISVDANMTGGIVTSEPLLKKLTSQEASASAIICKLP